MIAETLLAKKGSYPSTWDCIICSACLRHGKPKVEGPSNLYVSGALLMSVASPLTLSGSRILQTSLN